MIHTVRIPGTPEWMEVWEGGSINQAAMLKYSKTVESLTKTMKKAEVKHYLKLIEWSPADEVKVAAARVININKQGVDIMKKGTKKEDVKEVENDAAITLSDLQSRITDMEDDIQKIFTLINNIKFSAVGEAEAPAAKEKGKGKKGKDKEAKAPAPADKDVKKLLKELQEAKDNGEKKAAFKIRAKLRKAGYSLRSNNK